MKQRSIAFTSLPPTHSQVQTKRFEPSNTKPYVLPFPRFGMVSDRWEQTIQSTRKRALDYFPLGAKNSRVVKFFNEEFKL
jgi:hypothetical protein